MFTIKTLPMYIKTIRQYFKRWKRKRINLRNSVLFNGSIASPWYFEISLNVIIGRTFQNISRIQRICGNTLIAGGDDFSAKLSLNENVMYLY